MGGGVLSQITLSVVLDRVGFSCFVMDLVIMDWENRAD
jgi:hypothetical protein